MKQVSIIFYDSKLYDTVSFDKVNLGFGYKIKYVPNLLTRETAYMAKGHECVCVFVNDSVDSDVIKILSDAGVKLVVLRSAGYNNVDLAAAFGKMHVAHVPAYSPHAVAEHAVAMMMALNRKIHKAYNRTRDLNFSIDGLMGFDMYDKTAGVIGTGRIGRVLISILRGFGMNVLAYDVHKAQELEADKGVRYASLQEIYADSDVISLNCPLNDSTFHMINDESISAMKKGVMIINTGRGKLIDTKALIKGLKSGKIGSAGLDVYEEESEYFFKDYSSSLIGDDVLARLLTFNNVLITAHQAFFTEEALHNIAETTLGNVKEYFESHTLKNEICYQCKENVCAKDKKGVCF